ncbi:MAG: hypothetical protein Q9198_003587 [Flavoplaca austrocitrina]
MTGYSHKKEGYHKLATLMKRDHGIANFRRFDCINMLSLLSLQAEIQELQEDFWDQCRRDRDTGLPEKKTYPFWFQDLRRAEEGFSAQRQKLDVLREKVKEYNELLLQTSRLNSLNAPEASQLEALREWLGDPRGGANFLKQSESRIWEDEDGFSFVNVGKIKGERDMFTKFTSWFVISVLHRYSCLPRIVGRVVDAETGMVSYDESKLFHAGTITATVLSSTFPVFSIFILFIVKNTYCRIGVAAGFTAIFAIFLACFSSAKRVEIFAATATFAAVEVVFIGSALNPGS